MCERPQSGTNLPGSKHIQISWTWFRVGMLQIAHVYLAYLYPAMLKNGRKHFLVETVLPD